MPILQGPLGFRGGGTRVAIGTLTAAVDDPAVVAAVGDLAVVAVVKPDDIVVPVDQE